MDRLINQLGMQPSLFRTGDEQIDDALAEQEARIAYVDPALMNLDDALARGCGSIADS